MNAIGILGCYRVVEAVHLCIPIQEPCEIMMDMTVRVESLHEIAQCNVPYNTQSIKPTYLCLCAELGERIAQVIAFPNMTNKSSSSIASVYKYAVLKS